jgi:hypothetical protein
MFALKMDIDLFLDLPFLRHSWTFAQTRNLVKMESPASQRHACVSS